MRLGLKKLAGVYSLGSHVARITSGYSVTVLKWATLSSLGTGKLRGL